MVQEARDLFYVTCEGGRDQWCERRRTKTECDGEREREREWRVRQTYVQSTVCAYIMIHISS